MTVKIENAIIAGKVDDQDVAGDLVSLGYNLIGNGDSATITPMTGDQIGTAAMPIDPFLGPLADNGGPTQTHALLPGSPAIDQGEPVAGLATDQRGFPRAVDDPAINPPEGGDSSDIGPVESGIARSLNVSTRAGVLTGDNILHGVVRRPRSRPLGWRRPMIASPRLSSSSLANAPILRSSGA